MPGPCYDRVPWGSPWLMEILQDTLWPQFPVGCRVKADSAEGHRPYILEGEVQPEDQHQVSWLLIKRVNNPSATPPYGDYWLKFLHSGKSMLMLFPSVLLGLILRISLETALTVFIQSKKTKTQEWSEKAPLQQICPTQNEQLPLKELSFSWVFFSLFLSLTFYPFPLPSYSVISSLVFLKEYEFF